MKISTFCRLLAIATLTLCSMTHAENEAPKYLVSADFRPGIWLIRPQAIGAELATSGEQGLDWGTEEKVKLAFREALAKSGVSADVASWKYPEDLPSGCSKSSTLGWSINKLKPAITKFFSEEAQKVGASRIIHVSLLSPSPDSISSGMQVEGYGFLQSDPPDVMAKLLKTKRTGVFVPYCVFVYDTTSKKTVEYLLQLAYRNVDEFSPDIGLKDLPPETLEKLKDAFDSTIMAAAESTVGQVLQRIPPP